MNSLRDTSDAFVRQAYFMILRRAPDAEGLSNFQHLLETSNFDLKELYTRLLESKEFKERIIDGPNASIDHFKIFFGFEDESLLRRVEDGLRGLEPWPDVARSVAEALAHNDEEVAA